MKRRSSRLGWVIALAIVIVGVGATPAHALPVEDHYAAMGPWAVTYDKNDDGSSDTCDPDVAPGAALTIVYPSAIDTIGDLPIVVWGNGWSPGVADPVCNYRDIVEHVASWGYVVVAPNDGSVGAGTEMLSAVNQMISRNSDRSSTFYDELDTTRIAAYGHSQGADGAVNATIASDGLITSTVAYAMARPDWPRVDPPYPVPDTSQLSDPVFFVRGTLDVISTEAGLQSFYDAVPGAAAKASARWTGHVINGDSVNGYVTAWLEYTLYNVSLASSAFDGSPPEIALSAGWTNWASKNLP